MMASLGLLPVIVSKKNKQTEKICSLLHSLTNYINPGKNTQCDVAYLEVKLRIRFFFKAYYIYAANFSQS